MKYPRTTPKKIYDAFRKQWREFTPAELTYLVAGRPLSYQHGEFTFELVLTGDILVLHNAYGRLADDHDIPEIEADELAGLGEIAGNDAHDGDD